MRTLMRLSIPMESGNAAARAGTLASTMQKILQDMKTEAAYFTTTPAASGVASSFSTCKTDLQIPLIAEPFFLAFNAKIWFHPVTNAEDLAKAADGIEKAVKEYSKR